MHSLTVFSNPHSASESRVKRDLNTELLNDIEHKKNSSQQESSQGPDELTVLNLQNSAEDKIDPEVNPYSFVEYNLESNPLNRE